MGKEVVPWAAAGALETGGGRRRGKMDRGGVAMKHEEDKTRRGSGAVDRIRCGWDEIEK